MQTPTTEELRELARSGEDWHDYVQAATAVPLSPDEALRLWEDPDSDILDDTPEIECYARGNGDRICLAEALPADEPATSDRLDAWIEADSASTIEVRQ